MCKQSCLRLSEPEHNPLEESWRVVGWRVSFHVEICHFDVIGAICSLVFPFLCAIAMEPEKGCQKARTQRVSSGIPLIWCERNSTGHYRNMKSHHVTSSHIKPHQVTSRTENGCFSRTKRLVRFYTSCHLTDGKFIKGSSAETGWKRKHCGGSLMLPPQCVRLPFFNSKKLTQLVTASDSKWQHGSGMWLQVPSVFVLIDRFPCEDFKAYGNTLIKPRIRTVQNSASRLI